MHVFDNLGNSVFVFQYLMQFPAPALLIVTIKLISQRDSSGQSGEIRRSRLRFYDTSNEAYAGRQSVCEGEGEEDRSAACRLTLTADDYLNI